MEPVAGGSITSGKPLVIQIQSPGKCGFSQHRLNHPGKLRRLHVRDCGNQVIGIVEAFRLNRHGDSTGIQREGAGSGSIELEDIV